MLIEITQPPAGPAPEWVREAWVGVRMQARLKGDAPEVDFTTEGGRRPGGGGEIPNRQGFLVSVDTALQALMEKSPEAAMWFRDNLPKGMPALGFGADEATVVD